MSEKRILLVSLLKPVNDTRLYEKLGLSLCKLPGTTLHIAGFQAPLPADAPLNIAFHPVFSFRRLSIKRFAAAFTCFRLLKKIKPHLIIVATHELLLPCWLYCKLHKCKLVYDVQENYSLNLSAQDAYPPVLKKLLAFGVRTIEKFTAPAIAHFFLAERSYAQELPFLQERYSYLENKYKPEARYKVPPTPVLPPAGEIRLLYSGTISEIYGVFEAVQLAEKLHALHTGVSLTIIGYCAHSPTLLRLQKEIRNKPYINLIGGDRLVPHTQILEAIATHTSGLLPYRPNPSTFRCIPTKLYEYMAYGLPILIQQNPLWSKLVNHADSGINLNFEQPDHQAILDELLTRTWYNQGIPDFVYWQEEEQRLQATVQKLLTQPEKVH